MRRSDSNAFQVGFAENVQELHSVLRRKAAGFLVADRDLEKYAFELRSFHAEDAAKLAAHYNSSLTEGLQTDVAARRLEQYGRNIVRPPKHKSEIRKILLCMVSGFNPLLLIASVLAFVSWKPLGTRPEQFYNLLIAILFVFGILLTSTYNYLQERRTTIVLQSHERLIPPTCLVMRSGEIREITTADLVHGDLVVLQTGNRVPADMRVVSSSGLKVDKSMLTGESEPMRVTADPLPVTASYLEAGNTVFMGYHVVEGHGMGLVVSTGQYTQLGKIVQHEVVTPKRSPLQTQQLVVISTLTFIAIISLVVIVLYVAFYLRVKYPHYEHPSEFILGLLSLVASVVLIGLPLAIGGGLNIVSRRLYSKYFLFVKEQHSIETLGGITMLACDKTGTLTQNELSVTSLLSAADVRSRVARRAAGSESGNDLTSIDQYTTELFHSNSSIVQASYRVAALCNEAQLKRDDIMTSDGGAVQNGNSPQVSPDIEDRPPEPTSSVTGSKSTDRALLNWVKDNTDLPQLLADHTVLASIPFSPRTKRAISVVRHNTSGEVFVVTKGAPERMLPLCSHYMRDAGECMEMTEAFRDELMEMVEGEGVKGRRVLQMAQLGPLDAQQFPTDFEYQTYPQPNFPVSGFTFVSCLSITDAPRESAPGAVQALRDAHILVAMVTGDAVSSAVAIARQVGIISESSTTVDTVHTLHRKLGAAMTGGSDAIVVTGDEVESISGVEWDYVFRHTELVFARTTPEQKLSIVKQSQKRGHIVAVTGDGVNDAPSLKKADVGIAMNSGSAVAQEAAGIVLLNNDFGSIVHGVREGRLMFANLRKVLAYLMSTGSAAQLYTVLAVFFLGIPRPLSVFEMLVISYVTDVFGGIALMQETAEADLMQQPPRVRTARRLINWQMVLYSYLFIAPLLIIGAFYNYFTYMSERGKHVSGTSLVNPEATDVYAPVGYSMEQLFFAWEWQMFGQSALSKDAFEALKTASSVFFIALVVGQMAHLISIRQKAPYWYDAIMNPHGREGTMIQRLWHTVRNTRIHWPIVGAIAGSAIVVAIVLYVPAINQHCRTAPVTGRFWGLAVGWAALWFVVEQIRKWVFSLCGWKMFA